MAAKYASIGSLWCFYNRSCEPNAALDEEVIATENDTPAALVISHTTRLIKEGEENFISYQKLVGQNEDLRQENLQRWFQRRLSLYRNV